jgi:hypothetical protein
MVRRKLLDLALDAGLGRVFDEDRRAQQDVAVKLGLAGAVAADAVDVDAEPTMLSVRIVASCLSAVTVVMMCAPRIASFAVRQDVMVSPRRQDYACISRGGGVDVVKPHMR